MSKRIVWRVLMALLLGGVLKADVIILQSGKVITGNVLQQDGSGVLVQMDYGTFRYPASWIKDVRQETGAAPAESSSGERIPNWAKIVSALATNGWAHELKQIPATVIDDGILKNVPYISFRCNTGGYEINIYGDLDHPAGVEIGAVNYLVKSDAAKSNCVQFISSLLTRDEDRRMANALNLKIKDVKKRAGLTFEITRPDEPDAYGGWWVSVYDESALARARASGAELFAITQPRVETKAPPTVIPPVAEPVSQPVAWTDNDLSYSRPYTPVASGGDGRVYVRGYYRANGTYVHSYTRSYPHSHR